MIEWKLLCKSKYITTDEIKEEENLHKNTLKRVYLFCGVCYTEMEHIKNCENLPWKKFIAEGHIDSGWTQW